MFKTFILILATYLRRLASCFPYFLFLNFFGLVQFSEELVHNRTVEPLNEESSIRPSEQDPTDGERMTSELRDIISEFMIQVII